MEKKNVKQQAEGLLTVYLDENKLKKTPERYAVLKASYNMTMPFALQELLISMETETSFRVSRATIYNVVNLLVDARLLVKHSLGREIRYERSLHIVPSVYLVCTKCGKVRKTANKSVKEFIGKNKFGRFQVTNYSLFLYGECSKCRYAKNRKRSLKNKNKK